MSVNMKYIDADTLRVKITDLCANANFYQQKAIEKSNREDFVSSGGEIFAYAKVLSIITSLQQDQSDVDLEKDVESWFFEEISPKINIEHTMYYYFQECARRYYELGLNAKEENK